MSHSIGMYAGKKQNVMEWKTRSGFWKWSNNCENMWSAGSVLRSKRKKITIYETFYTVCIHKVAGIVIRDGRCRWPKCNNERWRRESDTGQRTMDGEVAKDTPLPIPKGTAWIAKLIAHTAMLSNIALHTLRSFSTNVAIAHYKTE